MKCSGCGHENRDTAKFCEECAAPLGNRPELLRGLPNEKREPWPHFRDTDRICSALKLGRFCRV
jgi:zinc-ribbon domain